MFLNHPVFVMELTKTTRNLFLRRFFKKNLEIHMTSYYLLLMQTNPGTYYIRRTCIEILQIMLNIGCIINGLDPVSMDPIHEGLLPSAIREYYMQSNGSSR